MKFDIAGARSEGYSDAEIADYLAQQVKFDVAGARKEGYTDAEIIGHLSSGQDAPKQPPTATEYALPTPDMAMPDMEPVSQSDPLYRMVRNVPSSAGRFVEDMAYPFMHPVQTAKGIGALATDPQARQQVVDMLKGRYGSLDAIGNTMVQDPVGVAADAAGLLSGAGLLTKAPGMAGKVGRVAGAMGQAVDPINIAAKAGGGLMKATIPATMPERLYGSAVKFSTTLPTAERSRRIQTALSEGITPTRGGLDKLNDLIEATNTSIANKIDAAAKAGDTLDTGEILTRLDTLKGFASRTVNPGPLLDDIAELEANFKKYHGEKIPVDVTQEIKKNTYVQLRKSYGEMKSVQVEAQKNVARGIKEELANKYPELAGLNAKDSALIALDQSLEKAVQRIENANMVGLGSLLAGGGVGAATQSPMAAIAAAAVKSIIDNPTVKGRLAIALNKARMKKYGAKGALPRALAYQAGRTSGAVEEQQ